MKIAWLAAPMILSGVLLVFSNAEARKVQISDLPVVGEFDRGEVEINQEGQTRIRREVQFKILNEQGRESESVQKIPFNARAIDLKLVKAMVINDGKETKVEDAQIEIKESAESDKAFDSMKQMVISFPNVQVGSQIYMHYEMNFHEVAMPGFWSQTSVYENVHLQEMHVKVVSALKLSKWIQDPEQILNFQESVDKKGRTVFEYSLRRPLMQGLIQEENPYRHPSRSVVVSLSSLPSWRDFAKDTIAAHELLLGEKLPGNLQQIVDQARKSRGHDDQDGLVNQLNFVTARLSEEFRYFGDWRRRKGGLMPRAIGEIAESRYGDCKDLSLITVAMYRALGLKANLVWIMRNELPQEKSWYAIPSEALFNHAVVRVQAPTGNVYWIDPTNPVSFAQGIPGDILNRPAFVLDSAGGYLDATPLNSSSTNAYSVKQVTRVLPAGKKSTDGGAAASKVQVNADLSWVGRWAVGVTGRLFFGSLEAVKYEIVKSLSGNDELLNYEFLKVPEKNRTVQDTNVKLTYELGSLGLKTTAGIGLPLLRTDTINDLIVTLKDRGSDLLLDHAGIETFENDLLGVERVGTVNLNCDLKSPWVNLRRTLVPIKGGIRIQDRSEVLQDHILREDLQSPRFRKFQADVRDCFYRAAVIFKLR